MTTQLSWTSWEAGSSPAKWSDFFDKRKNKYTVGKVEDVSVRGSWLRLVQGYCLLYGFRKRLAGGYYLSE